MKFDPGFDLRLREHSLAFDYGAGVFGPKPEYRSLEAIRPSLKDAGCDGPDPVYGEDLTPRRSRCRLKARESTQGRRVPEPRHRRIRIDDRTMRQRP